MRLRSRSLIAFAALSVAVACAAHRNLPPDGLNPQNAGAVGNGMASDVESGSGQFGSTRASAFAPVGFDVPELAAWIAMMQQATVTPMATTSGGTPTQTAAPTPTLSLTPTPSAAPSVTPPASATPTPATCDVSALSLAVDADADSFPDTAATASFSSCELSSGLGGVAATGAVTVTDDSAGNPEFSFQRVVNVGVTAGGASGSIQSTVTGRPTSTAGIFQIQQNAHLTLSTGVDALQHVSNWTFLYSPTSGAGWVAPWPLDAGTISMNGSWGVTVSGLTLNAVVSTRTPLTIAAPSTCATRVTAGSIQADFAPTATDGKSHSLVVTWTACGQKTRTLDGTLVP